MEPTTVYAATSIIKLVCESSYEGDELDQTCTMSESINVEASSLTGLVNKLGHRYGLAMDDLFIPGDEGEPVTGFDFDRYETADCDLVGEWQHEEWKAGRLKVWHAIYSFTIEKRIAEPIDFAEFKAAVIKTH